ncbi:MAG: TatD family hydrolase, partial [Thermoplasmata archaeon]
ILDILTSDRRVKPERVLIDHVEEHTIEPALDAGFWVGMTLYPITKCTPARAVDMVERYGTDRIMANSAGDWGHSDPMNVPDFIRTLRARGHDNETIHKLVYENPLHFFMQSRRFNFKPPIPVGNAECRMAKSE